MVIFHAFYRWHSLFLEFFRSLRLEPNFSTGAFGDVVRTLFICRDDRDECSLSSQLKHWLYFKISKRAKLYFKELSYFFSHNKKLI